VSAPGDVTHAIAAVGSRSLQKAKEFKEKFCPKGAIGQQEGHVGFDVEPVGSYKEVVDHAVCTAPCLALNDGGQGCS
jgi:hypothetical protein